MMEVSLSPPLSLFSVALLLPCWKSLALQLLEQRKSWWPQGSLQWLLGNFQSYSTRRVFYSLNKGVISRGYFWFCVCYLIGNRLQQQWNLALYFSHLPTDSLPAFCWGQLVNSKCYTEVLRLISWHGLQPQSWILNTVDSFGEKQANIKDITLITELPRAWTFSFF